jgi:head-tail adaptor
MIAGQLTEIVELYKPVIVVNDYGEQSTEYQLYNKTRARLLHNSGNREIVNSELFYSYTKTFVFRHYVNIDELNRIKWNGKFYKILDITPDKARMNIEVRTELINE